MLKNQIFRAGFCNIQVGTASKVGLGQFADLRKGLAKKKGVMFFRVVDTPVHPMPFVEGKVVVFILGSVDINNSKVYENLKNIEQRNFILQLQKLCKTSETYIFWLSFVWTFISYTSFWNWLFTYDVIYKTSIFFPSFMLFIWLNTNGEDHQIIWY